MKKLQLPRTICLLLAMPGLWYVIIGFTLISAGVCRALGSPKQPVDPKYGLVFSSVMAARPSAVEVSPNGQCVVTKEENELGFRLAVFDRVSKRVIYTPISKNTQYGLAWRPDSGAFAYQESSGPDRPLCLMDLKSGRTTHPNIPVSQSALLPAQWSPNGKFLAYFDGDWRAGRLLIFDPEAEDSPRVFQDGVVPGGACFAWSPDSAAIAVAARAKSGIITIKDLAQSSTNQINIGEEIGNIAWSPDCKFLLATVRGPADEYFNLIKISTKTGEISPEAEVAGDISNPFWLQDDKSFVYQITSNGISVILLSGPSGRERMIGPTDGMLELTHLSSDGKYAFGRYAEFTQPLSLVQITLNDGSYRQIYAPPRSSEVICPQPELIHLKSKDGIMIPGYYWHSFGETNPPRAALIVVHGGPHERSDATWSPLQYVMLKRGCDIIAVNYRGSSGYGQSFEKMGTDEERTWDVLAAKDYAVNSLKIPQGEIFFLGTSYGAPLAACAAAQGGEIGGLILVAWPRLIDSAGAQLHLRSSIPTIEFHGADDPIFSPPAARISMEQFFESAGDSAGAPRQIVFNDEGHYLDKASSIASEYWLTLKMMGLE